MYILFTSMVKGQDVWGFPLSPLKLLRIGLHLVKGIRDMLIFCVHNQFLFTVVDLITVAGI